MLENYSRVRLLTNHYENENLPKNSIGYIIEIYDDAYEVEFSDSDGITIGLVVLKDSEIQLTPMEKQMEEQNEMG